MLRYPGNDLISNGYSPHAEHTDFIEPKEFETLLSEFPHEDLFKAEEPEYRKNNQRPHWRKLMCYSDKKLFKKYTGLAPFFVDKSKMPESWRNLVDLLAHGKQYREWVGNTLQIKDFDIRLDWHRTKSGLDASPHIDSVGKLGSHLFYFMPKGWKEEFGGKTVFYKDKKVEKLNPEPEDFENSLEISVIGNKSMIFKNVPYGWHGVTKVDLESNTDTSIMHRQILNVVLLRRDI